jgi:molecular chaperone DnaK (HSP70)
LVALRDGVRLYGWDAWYAQNDPNATVVRSFKRFLPDAGPMVPVEIAGHKAPLIVLFSEMAAALQNAIRHRCNVELLPDEKLEVMLGVPAGANSNQRFLTVEAFRLAGFEVIGLLNEPSAASIEYGHTHRDKATKKDSILVYDLGGGTFDATLVELDERSHAVIASEGIATLGGDDFDSILAELALAQAGVSSEDVDSLTQAEWFRLEEEARRKKESLHPNSRRVPVDLDTVRAGWPQVHVPVADFYDRCQNLVNETLHAVEDLAARTESLEAIYVTGGGSEIPLVGRLLREQFKAKVKRSPYTRAATAIGLAIQADHAAEYVLRDQFTRYFGVWREAESGLRMHFDPLFAKGVALPRAAEPPLEQIRSYRAVHNIGHFRYLECSHVTEDGRPSGDITVWDEIYFPVDESLRDLADLSQVPVVHTWRNTPVQERYGCGPGGELDVTITNLEAGYERRYRLGKWGAKSEPIVPGKKRKPAARRKKANSSES